MSETNSMNDIISSNTDTSTTTITKKSPMTTEIESETLSSQERQTAPLKELISWAFYEFANSGFSCVVITAIFNAYFVGVIAASKDPGDHSGMATFLWTLTIAISNALVVFSAPLIGTIADHCGAKKRLLAIAAIGCTIFTALLALAGPGGVALAMTALIIANFLFATGENLVFAFLPELASPRDIGKVSALGATIGHLGGPCVLLLCLGYVSFAKSQGMSDTTYVPHTMLIVAAVYAIATIPMFYNLKERAPYKTLDFKENYFAIGLDRLVSTVKKASHYQDLFRFLVSLLVYSCGIATIVVLASIYAQEVIGFTVTDSIIMILVVNLTGAFGAFLTGKVIGKLGPRNMLLGGLLMWMAATAMAYFCQDKNSFWMLANLIGLAMGTAMACGRAIVGQFSPTHRAGEFFGLMGLFAKLAGIFGPLTYGCINYMSQGNHRQAILSTVVFFAIGFLLLLTVNEKRGIDAAQTIHD